jgi:hypothetical protein
MTNVTLELANASDVVRCNGIAVHTGGNHNKVKFLVLLLAVWPLGGEVSFVRRGRRHLDDSCLEANELLQVTSFGKSLNVALNLLPGRELGPRLVRGRRTETGELIELVRNL